MASPFISGEKGRVTVLKSLSSDPKSRLELFIRIDKIACVAQALVT